MRGGFLCTRNAVRTFLTCYFLAKVMNITYTNKEDFSLSNTTVLFDDELYANTFCICTYNNKHYKFSWASRTIKPEIHELRENVFSIGVDQVFLIYDFSTDRALLKCHFFSYFYESLIIGEKLIIICELEYSVVDLNTCTVVGSDAFPDIFVKCEVLGDRIKVDCMSGYNSEIPI